MRKFSLQDVLAIPAPEQLQETKTFEAGGEEWTITVWADGKSNANRFYTLRELFATPIATEANGEKVRPLRLTLPGGTAVEVTNAGYIGSLEVLEAVAIDPAFSAVEWAAFGSRLGPKVMDEIFDWVTNINGLSEWFTEQAKAAKNALSAENPDGKNGSSAHASAFSKISPKEHSKA